MKETIIEVLNYAGALGLVIVANILLGCAKANKYNEFSGATFWNGIKKTVCAVIALGLIVAGGVLIPNIEFNLPIAETPITLLHAVSVVLVTAIITYGGSAVSNLLVVLGIKEDYDLKNLQEQHSEVLEEN